jgi:hypothetical protein
VFLCVCSLSASSGFVLFMIVIISHSPLNILCASYTFQSRSVDVEQRPKFKHSHHLRFLTILFQLKSFMMAFHLETDPSVWAWWLDFQHFVDTCAHSLYFGTEIYLSCSYFCFSNGLYPRPRIISFSADPPPPRETVGIMEAHSDRRRRL